jgi:hypothetical protein
MIPHSSIPLAHLDENELDEVHSLNAELGRVQKTLAKVMSDREVVNARATLFLHALKKRYDLTDKMAVIDGEYLYEIETEHLL